MNSLGRVLVTGGAGMIGRRVVKNLCMLGSEVCVIDNLSSGMAMPDAVSRPIVADIRDIDLMGQVFRSFKPTTVFHLAAVHHIPTCELQRSYALSVNVVGTENILTAAEFSGVERLVLASSGAVYAWTNQPLAEDETPLAASDNYSVCKLTNEQQIRLWAQRSGGMARVARIFNTIAADDPNAHLIPDVMRQIKEADERAEIFLGNLTPRRDYIHADDVADGVIKIALDSRNECNYDAFNICSGTEFSVEDVVQTIGLVFEKQVKITKDERRVRAIDRGSQLGVPDKCIKILDWKPSLLFRDAIAKTVLPKAD